VFMTVETGGSCAHKSGYGARRCAAHAYRVRVVVVGVVVDLCIRPREQEPRIERVEAPAGLLPLR